MSLKTIEEVKKDLDSRGISVPQVARSIGVSPRIVYALLQGRIKGRRGQAHRAAVALGLKDGKTNEGQHEGVTGVLARVAECVQPVRGEFVMDVNEITETSKKIRLSRCERVVAVVPERCSGPGWNNSPTWVYIMSPGGAIRTECIQPDERTPELKALYEIGDVVCRALIDAVPVTTEGAIRLSSGERIVAVVPERCSGPGWSNWPTWVYIMSPGGAIRTECIQPDERTPELKALYEIGDVVCRALIDAVPVTTEGAP